MWSVGVLLFGLACQQKPTMVGSEAQYIVKSPQLKTEIRKSSQISKNLVVVDLRDPFEYEKYNIRGSLYFPPSDWMEKRGKTSKQLLSKLDFIQRFALRGADPTKTVVIISDDLMRSYAFQKLLRDVGVKNILNASIEELRSNPLSQVQLENQKPWSADEERFELDAEAVEEKWRQALPRVSSPARSSALQMQLPERTPRFVILELSMQGKTQVLSLDQEQKTTKGTSRKESRGQISINDLELQKDNCRVKTSDFPWKKSDFYLIEFPRSEQGYVQALGLTRCLELSGYENVFVHPKNE